MALDQTELAQIVSAVLTAMRSASPQAAASKPVFLPKGSKAAPSDLASRDQQILNAFHRKGFKDVRLMDRSNPSADYNIRPFKGWLEQGRVVRRGQKSVKGLFHIDQTDLLPGKSQPKPSITAETKGLFDAAKAKLKAKQAKGKPQPTLV